MGEGMDKSWGDVTYQVGDDVRIFAEGDLPYSLGRIIAIGKVRNLRRVDNIPKSRDGGREEEARMG